MYHGIVHLRFLAITRCVWIGNELNGNLISAKVNAIAIAYFAVHHYSSFKNKRIEAQISNSNITKTIRIFKKWPF